MLNEPTSHHNTPAPVTGVELFMSKRSYSHEQRVNRVYSVLTVPA